MTASSGRVRTSLWAFMISCLMVLGGTSTLASAQAPDSAREAFELGMSALDEGRFLDASRAFERSFAAAPRLPTAFNWALSLRGLGDALAAEALYQRLLDGELGRLRPRDREAVESLLAEVRATIATLRLTIHGPEDLEARLDGRRLEVVGGQPAELRVNPGERVLVATALEHESVERRFVAAGEDIELELRLEVRLDERPGTLVLRSSDPDAYFVVEGFGEGITPWRGEVPAGRRAITVRGAHGERTTEVEVPAGRRVALTLDPPERSVLRRPWFWVVAGVVVAGIVAGAIAVSRIERQAPPIESEVFPPIFALTAN